MKPQLAPNRRRVARPGSVRGKQAGVAALRGLVLAAGLAVAVVLQLAGPGLQRGLGNLVGVHAMAPVAAKASAPAAARSCGSPSAAYPMHPCKVALAAFAIAPVV